MQQGRDVSRDATLDECLTSSRPRALYKPTESVQDIIGQLISRLAEESRYVDNRIILSDRLNEDCKDVLRREKLYADTDAYVSARSIGVALESQIEAIIRNSDKVLTLIDGELSSFLMLIHYEFCFEIYEEENFRAELRAERNVGNNSIIFNNKITWKCLPLYLSLSRHLSMRSSSSVHDLREQMEVKAMVLVADNPSIQNALNEVVSSKILQIFDSINKNEHKEEHKEGNGEDSSWTRAGRVIHGAVTSVVRAVSNLPNQSTIGGSDHHGKLSDSDYQRCLENAAHMNIYTFTVFMWHRNNRNCVVNSIKKLNFDQYDFATVIAQKYFPRSYDQSGEYNRCFYLSAGIGMRVHPVEVITQMRELASSALANNNYLEYLSQNGAVVEHTVNLDSTINEDGSIRKMFNDILIRNEFFDLDALRYLWPRCFRNKLLCTFSFETRKVNGQNPFKSCPFYRHPDDTIDAMSPENIIFLHHDGQHFTLLRPKDIIMLDGNARETGRLNTTNFFQNLKLIFDEHNVSVDRMNACCMGFDDLKIPYIPDQESHIYDPTQDYSRLLRK